MAWRNYSIVKGRVTNKYLSHCVLALRAVTLLRDRCFSIFFSQESHGMPHLNPPSISPSTECRVACKISCTHQHRSLSLTKMEADTNGRRVVQITMVVLVRMSRPSRSPIAGGVGYRCGVASSVLRRALGRESRCCGHLASEAGVGQPF